jgi:hypothetical protein
MAKQAKKYISKYLNLKLVDKASYTKEVDGRVVVVPGKSIQFNQGVYETEDPDEIKFLESHANFGSVFIEVKEDDLQKARKEQFKDLETKEAELKAKEEELKKKEKALEEGESVPKRKGKSKTKKKEKPAF